MRSYCELDIDRYELFWFVSGDGSRFHAFHIEKARMKNILIRFHCQFREMWYWKDICVFIVDLKPNPTGSPTTTTPSASVDPFKTTGTTGTHSIIAIFYMCFISRQVVPCPLLNKTSYSMMSSADAMWLASNRVNIIITKLICIKYYNIILCAIIT